MRLVVTGTREGRPDVAYWLDRWVRKFGRPTLVILGDARGVDEQARQWCIQRGYLYKRHKATWYPYEDMRCCLMDRLAGFYRNEAMVLSAIAGTKPFRLPNAYCVAFPHRTRPSSGTRDCVTRSKRHKLAVTVLEASKVWPIRDARQRPKSWG